MARDPGGRRTGGPGRAAAGLAAVIATLVLGFALGLALAALLRDARAPSVRGPAPPPVGARPPAVAPGAPDPSVRVLGDTGPSGARTRAALERVLATGVGVRARQLLESGALPGPLTIVVNDRGDRFTPYRVPGSELGETIVFDPDDLPLVETEEGPRPALPETVLAHELGHAVFKLVSEEAVIRAVENPIRDDLGLPRRLRF